MSPAANQLYQTALTRTSEVPEELADLIWQSLDPAHDSLSVEESWNAEIKRRIQSIERGDAQWLTEEEVNQRLEAKYGPLLD